MIQSEGGVVFRLCVYLHLVLGIDNNNNIQYFNHGGWFVYFHFIDFLVAPSLRINGDTRSGRALYCGDLAEGLFHGLSSVFVDRAGTGNHMDLSTTEIEIQRDTIKTKRFYHLSIHCGASHSHTLSLSCRTVYRVHKHGLINSELLHLIVF
jgi:hypothetical protein